MPPLPMPEPDPTKPNSSATGVLRGQSSDATFEADFADLAARFAAQSGGGLSAELSADLALEIVLNEVVEQACLATGATGAAIALERNGEMVCRASSGSTAPELGAHLDSASGLSGECIRTRRTQRCDDVLADLRVDVEASARLGVRSVMVMPLLREAELVGVFELFSSLPSAFGERDERTLEALAGRILSNLVLSREPAIQLLPAQPETLPVAETLLPVEVLTTPQTFQEFIPDAPPDAATGIAGGSPARGFDFVTTILGAAVLACAVLLGVLLGRHFGFQRPAARVRPAPISTANSVAPVPVASPPSAEKEVSPAATAVPVKAGGEAIPPGSLRVYDNGKEIFRQSPVQNEPVQNEPQPGGGMQRALSVVPEEGSGLSNSAVVLHRVEPEYPENARQMQLQGQVVLDVRIGEDGGVQEMTLVSGQPLLVQAAKDAVQKWRFKPQTANGHPATMQTRITLNFRLPQ